MDKELLNEVEESMEIFYALVMESYDDYSKSRDYGNGQFMPMAEIHTLSLIAENGGILVSDVAKMWNRTLSAASQNVNKLVKKGLVKKVKEPGNNKAVHLYATEKGCELSKMHREYDDKSMSKVASVLLQRHTIDELRTAVSVLKTGLDLYENGGF
ncbi:MAG: MarR family winged helix-turn-helix transcriptional regulator [Clostridiales bacterium]|nr:MarR family winged helix-turn-helix transcriptional regulator [Clostridiales bacterium]